MGDVAEDSKIKQFFQCLADACKSVEMMASNSSAISDSITVGLILAGAAIGGFFFRSVRIGTVVGSTVACFVKGGNTYHLIKQLKIISNYFFSDIPRDYLMKLPFFLKF